MPGQKTEESCFYQNRQCVIVKKSKFIKQQELSRLLSSLGIKMFFSKIPLVGLSSSFVLEALTSQM